MRDYCYCLQLLTCCPPVALRWRAAYYQEHVVSRQQIHTVRHTVGRKLRRLAEFEACTVPELIRQAFGSPTGDDRHPAPFTKAKATKAARGGR